MNARLQANLLRAGIQPTQRRVRPPAAITTPCREDTPSDPDKGLSDNRERYFAQSAMTGIAMRDGGPAPVLPIAQAQDVLRWAAGAHA